ncbi:MHC class II transactivator [Gastrophryne carolinensis]
MEHRAPGWMGEEISEEVQKPKRKYARRCITESKSLTKSTQLKSRKRGIARNTSQSDSTPPKHKKRGVSSSSNITDGKNSPKLSGLSCLAPPIGSFVVPASPAFHSGNLPMLPAVVHQQTLNFYSNVIICTASPFEATEPCTIPSPTTTSHHTKHISSNTSIPSSPDRNCSSSPFAPSAFILPSSPEATSMCQQPETGTDESTEGKNISSIRRENMKNEHVAAFQESLKKQHREAFVMDIKALCTDIELVKSRLNPRNGKLVSKNAEKELVNYDLAEEKMAKVELCCMFDDSGLETRIFALLGESGIGKTVLAKMICREWSAGKFQQFSFVFLFECQKIDAHKQYSLKDFLLELSSCPSEKKLDIYQYILRNPEKILLIFDGFDEFQDSESLLQGTPITTPSKAYKAQEIFTGLFQKKFLRGCTMLITTRPKDKFNQHLGKVDQIVELMGFTPRQVEWYIKEYFKSMPDFTGVFDWIKEHEYLYSYCYVPLICKFVCYYAESNYNTGIKSFSLSALFLNLLQNSPQALGTNCEPKDNTTVDTSSLHLDSTKNMKCALHKSKVSPYLQGKKSTLSYSLVQSFFKAQHALENMNERNLVRYISLDLKRRRNLENCPDMVRRFLLGLMYCKNKCSWKKNTGLNSKTTEKIDEYFQTLRTLELCPHRLLELFHCVVATHCSSIAQCLASKLSENLSFINTRLNPPDVFVLQCILRKSRGHISLDLRKTHISQEGLQEVVCLKSVSSFRASLGDTVSLWRKLLAEQNYATLKKCVMKFTVDPFQADRLEDITDLAALLDIQKDICNGNEESQNAIKEIPAVKNLSKIAFGLGKKYGQDGFLKLVGILPKLPALQHLDLCNLTENHIGDKGIEKLVETFSELKTLHTLDLSQNNITGVGARKIAAALPSLCCLQTLSLYNNNVCDMGAQMLADILPSMESLEALHLDCNRITDVGAEKLAASLQKCPQMKSLRMYNMTIPHGILLRLQQQDSRISCLSIG